MNRRARRLSIGLVLATVAVAIGALSFLQRRSSLFATIELPSPNGYEALVRAGQSVGEGVPPDVTTASADQLRSFVESNQDALASAREALIHESRVPVNHSPGYLSKETARLGAVRQVARVLLAEGRLAEKDGRHSDALKSYLDLVHVGFRMAHGGLLLHLEAGSAYETAALAALEGLQSDLSPGDAKHLLDALESLQAQQEPFEAFAEREREFSRETNGWLASVVTGRLAQAAYNRVANQYDGNIIRRKQLMADLRR